MRKLQVPLLGLCMVAALSLAGCGNEKVQTTPSPNDKSAAPNDKPPPKISSDPVKLTLSTSGVGLDQKIGDMLVEHVKKKYPNITLEIMPPGKDNTVEGMVAGGTTPDIMFTYSGNINALRAMNVLYDLTPLVKSQMIDLSRIEPGHIADVKVRSAEKDELYGIPFLTDFHGLYYNKDLFDKFGVPYPQDGMVWDDALNVARKVTRMDGGTQYRGLESQNSIWVTQGLSLFPVDAATNKATVINDQYKLAFELLKSIYSIPGNQQIAKPAKNQFIQDRTLAMLLDLNSVIALQDPKNLDLNWDMAQYPSFPDKPNIHGGISVRVLMISAISKHKEQAMQVLDVASSEEFQTAMSRQATMPILKSDAVKQVFGADYPALKNKRLQSIFKSKPAQTTTVASIYKAKAEAIVLNKINEYIKGNVDVNTALQQADEEINKMVETERIK
ncbi:ABC transporter substrate-binding protein [Paenibacillus hodogayensis]|uniref:ABC transporter substrate-binding protein n=1 Tax=Paenibacillus hodogayensis TaxID=279208 RepID=A0ABV5VSA1_9BACL